MDINERYDVVGMKLNSNYSGGGVVRVLFYYDQDGVLQEIDPDLFPSGKCWIIKDYMESIDSKFDDFELFKISEVVRTNNQGSTATPDNFVEWCCPNSTKISPISHELFPVVAIPLPDIDTGEILGVEESLQRGYYFIRKEESVYGPFEITIDFNKQEKALIGTAMNTPSLSCPSHHVTKLPYDDLSKSGVLLTADVDGKKLEYVSSLKQYGKTLNGAWEHVDYISASQLLKYVSELKVSSGKKLMSNSTLSQVKQDIERFLTKRDSHISSKQRYKRAVELIGASENENDEWADALNEFLKTEKGKDALVENQARIQEQNRKEEVISRERELAEKKEAVSQASKELKHIQGQISEKAEELNRTKEELEVRIREQTTGLQEEKSAIESSIKVLGEDLELLQLKYESLKTIDDLNTEKGYLERDRRILESAVSTLESTLRNPKKIVESVVEVDSVMKLLGYSSREEGRCLDGRSYAPNDQVKVFGESKSDAFNLIASISSRISDMGGRELSELEVANVLICMQQNFLTIFQGNPGVGKTSTVINLARALGVFEPKVMGQRGDFLNIPVARGWSGSRDLIGFYNSLRGGFQSSRTGLYEFLKDGEVNGCDANARIVLLDEANLSPIEHYWSDFIGLTDKEGSSRELYLGGGAESSIYPAKYGTLRFLATINNDSTTERVSQRLISRAPIISMDGQSNYLGSEFGGEAKEFDGAIPAHVLNSFFGRDSVLVGDRSRGEDLIDGLKKVIDTGVRCAKSLTPTIGVEGRKSRSIISFLNVAGELFPDSIAQDLALEQYVIPQLSGDGDAVRSAIQAMVEQAESNDMYRSANVLKKILSEGDDYLQNYSFF